MLRPALLLGYVLALVVLAAGFLEGGRDGPCAGSTRFVRDNPGAASFRAERQLLPPGRRCVALAPDGAVLESHSYPELGDYALALLLLLMPAGLWEAYRLRGRWLRRSIVQRPGFWPALAIACVLAFLAWAGGYFKDGMDGPCATLPWAPGTVMRHEDRVLPPGQRCVAVARDGTEASSPWRPGPSDHLWALGLFVLPFAVWGVTARVRLSVSGAH